MKNLSSRFSFVLMSLALVFLVGCGARPSNVALSDSFWAEKNQKVVVARVKDPEPRVNQVGGQGLLDLAITSIANKSINNHLKNTDLSWYNEMPSDFTKRLKKSHPGVSMYSKSLDPDKKSQEAVLAQFAGDQVLTLELRSVGARREYHGFIPQGSPDAYCVLIGQLVDPKDQKNVLWRHEAEIIIPVEGEWDQPSNFPNFSRALHTAMQEAKQEVMDSFFSGR